MTSVSSTVLTPSNCEVVYCDCGYAELLAADVNGVANSKLSAVGHRECGVSSDVRCPFVDRRGAIYRCEKANSDFDDFTSVKRIAGAQFPSADCVADGNPSLPPKKWSNRFSKSP